VLEISNHKNVYAGNTTIWQAGCTVAEVEDKLVDKATRFAEWSRKSGLTMNASKTFFLLSINERVSCHHQGHGHCWRSATTKTSTQATLPSGGRGVL
jgi:hypothetical protein